MRQCFLDQTIAARGRPEAVECRRGHCDRAAYRRSKGGASTVQIRSSVESRPRAIAIPISARLGIGGQGRTALSLALRSDQRSIEMSAIGNGAYTKRWSSAGAALTTVASSGTRTSTQHPHPAGQLLCMRTGNPGNHPGSADSQQDSLDSAWTESEHWNLASRGMSKHTTMPAGTSPNTSCRASMNHATDWTTRVDTAHMVAEWGSRGRGYDEPADGPCNRGRADVKP